MINNFNIIYFMNVYKLFYSCSCNRTFSRIILPKATARRASNVPCRLKVKVIGNEQKIIITCWAGTIT